jgi:hypothetical protein
LEYGEPKPVRILSIIRDVFGGFTTMKIRFANLLLVTITLTLAACTASRAQEPIPTPTSVPAILPTPLSTVSFDERLLATVNIADHPLATANPIGNHPDEIVFAGDFIWVKTENGHVIQIDPTTNEMVSAIKVDTTTDLDHSCQGLGTDGENVWVCSASGDEDSRTIDVVRIDLQTQSVVETIKVEKNFEQFDMPFLSNQIWVLSGNGDKLIGIDVTTNQPSPAIDLGTRCFQLAGTGKALFATCAIDNLVLQIDPESREVIARVTVKNPRNIAATENAIWVVQDNAIVRLDPQSLNPVLAFTNLPGVGSTGDIFATEEAVWVRQESGFLYRIDPANNELTEQIKPDQSFTGGSVLATSDSIWTTAIDDNLLIRLSLR